MGDVDSSSKFIDNNRCLTFVATPEFSSGVLRISMFSGFVPRAVRFTSVGRTVVHTTYPILKARLYIICCNSFEVMIISNVYVTGDVIKFIRCGECFDPIPILFRVALSRF